MNLVTDKVDKIKILSEEVNTVMGATPRKLVRWGNLVILIFTILALVFAWFVQYPDTVRGKVQLQLDKEPIIIKSLQEGHMENIFVKDGQMVKKEGVLFTLLVPCEGHADTSITFRAPENGKVKLLNSISRLEMEKGEVILAIIPVDTNDTKVTVNVPSPALAEIELGQNVIISLDNYPSRKYGKITGSVSGISPIMQNKRCEITVTLNSSLASYNRNNELLIISTGYAVITTRNKRLLERMVGLFAE